MQPLDVDTLKAALETRHNTVVAMRRARQILEEDPDALVVGLTRDDELVRAHELSLLPRSFIDASEEVWVFEVAQAARFKMTEYDPVEDSALNHAVQTAVEGKNFRDFALGLVDAVSESTGGDVSFRIPGWPGVDDGLVTIVTDDPYDTLAHALPQAFFDVDTASFTISVSEANKVIAEAFGERNDFEGNLAASLDILLPRDLTLLQAYGVMRTDATVEDIRSFCASSSSTQARAAHAGKYEVEAFETLERANKELRRIDEERERGVSGPSVDEREFRLALSMMETSVDLALGVSLAAQCVA